MAVQGNPVGRLQEHAQAGAANHPVYEVTASLGESHCPKFVMQVHNHSMSLTISNQLLTLLLR